jgi:hypothetical protein
VTPQERASIVALLPGMVRYLPASFEKRFGRAVASRAIDDPTWEPSEKQWAQIRRLAHRYRRQIPRAHDVLCEACGPEHTAPQSAEMLA